MQDKIEVSLHINGVENYILTMYILAAERKYLGVMEVLILHGTLYSMDYRMYEINKINKNVCTIVNLGIYKDFVP